MSNMAAEHSVMTSSSSFSVSEVLRLRDLKNKKQIIIYKKILFSGSTDFFLSESLCSSNFQNVKFRLDFVMNG